MLQIARVVSILASNCALIIGALCLTITRILMRLSIISPLVIPRCGSRHGRVSPQFPCTDEQQSITPKLSFPLSTFIYRHSIASQTRSVRSFPNEKKKKRKKVREILFLSSGSFAIETWEKKLEKKEGEGKKNHCGILYEIIMKTF